MKRIHLICILSCRLTLAGATARAAQWASSLPCPLHRTQRSAAEGIYDQSLAHSLDSVRRRTSYELLVEEHARRVLDQAHDAASRVRYEMKFKKQCARARPPLFEPTNVVSTKRRCKSKGVFISEPCCHHWVTLGKQVTLPWSAPSYRRRGPLAHRERG